MVSRSWAVASILAGVVLGAITVYIVDRKFMQAGAFAFAGGVLTFFGLMHGEAIGVNQTPTVALSYLVVGGVLVACAKIRHRRSPGARGGGKRRTARKLGHGVVKETPR